MPSRLTRTRHALWTYKWVVLVSTCVVAGGAGLTARSRPVLYQAEAVIVVTPPRVSSDWLQDPLGIVSFSDRLPAIQQQVLSRTRLERIIVNLDLYGEARRVGRIEDIVDEMQRNVRVQTSAGGAFRVAFVDRDPRTAMRVADRISSMIMEETAREREVLVEGSNRFLKTQIEETREQLLRYEKQIDQMQASPSGPRPSQIPVIEYEALQVSYRELLAKYHVMNIASNLERRQQGQQFKLVDQARMPREPLGPRPLTVSALGALGGLSFGLVLVAVLPRRSPRP